MNIPLVNSTSSVRLPVQRNGFRYIPAGQVEGMDPGWYEEKYYLGKVALSLHDRSREVDLDHQQTLSMACGGQYGYRSIMATHGADKYGKFYYEVIVEEPLNGDQPHENVVETHIRVGLARIGANLSGPVGMDQLGFGFCDTGHIVHNASKKKVTCRVINVGTRIGVSISIGEKEGVAFPPEPPSHKLIYYYSQYFEHTITPEQTVCDSKMNASIQLYVDGVPVDEHFRDIPLGVYFPMISLYRGAKVRFVPDRLDMLHLPEGFLPWSELYSVRRINLGSAVPVDSTIDQGQFADPEQADIPAVEYSSVLVGQITTS